MPSPPHPPRRAAISLPAFALLGVGVVACLSGCAEYHPRPISPAASAAAIEARSLHDARLRRLIAATDGAAPRQWGLSQLTLAALYFHPSLDVARAKLAEAKAGVVTAKQFPNPSLNFEEISYNATVAAPSPWTIAPVINFLIETAGKRGTRTAEAQALEKAARDDLATAAWQVRGDVRNALLDMWAAQRRRALLGRRLALQNQLVRLLEDRLAAGQASALDVARERANRNQASLDYSDMARQEVEARARLAGAIGVPLQALDGVDFSFAALDRPKPPALAIGALRRQALQGRSDIRAMLAQYAAAESALKLQTANQYPNITLTPGYAYDAGSNKYMLFPSTDLPIFNQNQGPIAEAVAKRREVAARFVALQARIIAATDGAAAGYRAAAKVVRAADSLLAGEKDRARRVSRSFQAGQIDRPALIAAEIEEAKAAESRFNAVVQQRRALGAVEDALQHTFFGPALPQASLQSPRKARASSS